MDCCINSAWAASSSFGSAPPLECTTCRAARSSPDSADLTRSCNFFRTPSSRSKNRSSFAGVKGKYGHSSGQEYRDPRPEPHSREEMVVPSAGHARWLFFNVFTPHSCPARAEKKSVPALTGEHLSAPTCLPGHCSPAIPREATGRRPQPHGRLSRCCGSPPSLHGLPKT